jgi:hypothetical protein
LRTLAKILKSLLIFLSSFVAVAVLLAFVVFLRPSIAINNTTLSWAAEFLKLQGIYVGWSKLSVSVTNDPKISGFFGKVLDFAAKDICVNVVNMDSRLCFRDAEIRGKIVFRNFTPVLTEIGPISLTGGGLIWRSSPDNAKTATKKENFIPIWLKELVINETKIELVRAQIDSGSENVIGKATVTGKPNQTGMIWNTSISSTIKTSEGDIISVGALGDLKSKRNPLNGLLSGAATVKAEARKRKLDLNLKLAETGAGQVGLDLMLRGNSKEARMEAQFEGIADKTGGRGVLRGHLDRFSKNVKFVDFPKCDIALKDMSKIDLSCPIKMALSLPDKNLYKNFGETLSLDLKLSAQTTNRLEFSPSGPITVDADLSAFPLFKSARDGKAVAKLKLEGNLDDLSRNWKINSRASLEVKRFEKIVQMLSGSPYAIPEPINSLNGSAVVSVSSSGEFPLRSLDFPIEFETELKSATQDFSVKGEGEFRYSQKKAHNKLQMKITLTDVKLALPHMALGTPPRFFPDARIQLDNRKVSAVSNDSNFEYEINIATAPEKPLHLASNLAKSPIPLNIGLFLSSKKNSRGHCKVERFEMDLFRRHASVEYFNFKLGNEFNSSELNGEIKVAYTDYTIWILISGRADKPVVHFQSDPPLPDDKLIAILLFGRDLNVLDPGQADSVGHAQAAIANGAISLASMYLLASTPVESIGYDLSKGVFSATVRLANGTSLNVGSDLSQLNTIGVRKRLNSHWTIDTFMENAFDPTKRSLSGFLLWSDRY